MNNIKLTVTIPSLSLLTPIGTDTYALVARFFKSDGTNLDSPYIANSNSLTVVTTTTTFSVDIPVVNGTWSIDDPIVKLYANDSTNCCFAMRIGDILNTVTEISTEGVVINALSSGRVYKYEPSSSATEDLFTGLNSSDVAHTPNKLFLYDTHDTGSSFVLRLREYNITLSPFTQSFSKDYTLSLAYMGAGLCAISDTELYIAGAGVYKIILSGTTATATLMFNFASSFECTGDLIYDKTTELMLISYHNSTAGSYRIGVFNALTGAIVRSAAAPTNDVYGIYQYTGNTYIITGTGDTYSLNLTTLATTLLGSVGETIAGASQIQSNISIPS